MKPVLLIHGDILEGKGFPLNPSLQLYASSKMIMDPVGTLTSLGVLYSQIKM